MVRLSNLTIFLLCILLTSCLKEKTSYENYNDCLNKITNKNKALNEQVCFEKYSDLEVQSSSTLQGIGSINLPPAGEFNSYKIFNGNSSLIRVVKTMILSKTTEELILQCQFKILKPHSTTKIKCYNFLNDIEKVSKFRKIKQKTSLKFGVTERININ